MQDRPFPAEIVEVVAAYLRDLQPGASDPHQAFQVRVAANALDIAARELTFAEVTDREELRRLEQLTARRGTLEDLNQRLCGLIRDGGPSRDTAELYDHLWRTTLAKLAVDQPGYAAYRRALDQSPAKQEE